ncbi:MAG: XylR family transcriptional regulator [Acidobacteria bacterium]|nr:MAG: XylR family transcriptional regulator [Acidobacteriota bacterium]
MKKRLSRARTPQVALLLETSTEYGRGILRGILRYSRLHGPWSMYVAPRHLDQVLPEGESWNGTGIIARIRSPQMQKQIRSTGLPFVASQLGESSPPKAGRRFGEIDTHSSAIAQMGVKHLLERGLRGFAFCGFMNCHWSVVREMEYVRLLREKRFPCFVRHIHMASWIQQPHWLDTWRHEQPGMVSWLRSLPKPAGLMACNDVCGRQVLQACVMAGLRVPDDVAVIGVDNDDLICELSDPPLSSVALDLERAGYESAQLLDGLMSGRIKEGYVVHVEPTHVVTRRSTDVIAQDDRLIVSALRFISDHFAQSISVNDVAEEVGTSRRTLERHFSKAIGRSILSEIARCRIERAKELLLETKVSCYSVASGVGFHSLKTFNRTFHRREAVTPQGFRKMARSTAGPNASAAVR